MKFKNILMGTGLTVLLSAGTYSVSNLYYFGPKKYKEMTENSNVTTQELNAYGNSVYPKSLGATWLSAAGAIIFVMGLRRKDDER